MVSLEACRSVIHALDIWVDGFCSSVVALFGNFSCGFFSLRFFGKLDCVIPSLLQSFAHPFEVEMV